ncbi:hypothetical protein [Nocardia carnea]|uniref:hypothetical protein n=1 Tax=Nocardia carnea TaxID=37328 RepID=UPI002453C643|nr:hypothetical protein [Nocardia carnea]
MSDEGYAVDLTELEAAATRLGNLIGFVEDSLQQIDGRDATLRAGWFGVMPPPPTTPPTPNWSPVCKARGEARGRAEALIELLTLKFGPLPADIVARVRSADVSEFRTWTAQALAAASLNEMFA